MLYVKNRKNDLFEVGCCGFANKQVSRPNAPGIRLERAHVSQPCPIIVNFTLNLLFLVLVAPVALQEAVSGVLVITTPSALPHNGIMMTSIGQVRPHISAATASLFDGFSAAAKPSDISKACAHSVLE